MLNFVGYIVPSLTIRTYLLEVGASISNMPHLFPPLLPLFFFFGHVEKHVDLSSPARDLTCAPCSESVKS